MPAERKKHALLYHSEALEEVGTYDLETDNGEGEVHQAHAMHRQPLEFGVVGEHRHCGSREEFEYQEAHGGHEGGPENAQPVYLLDSLAFACSEIVTGDGLHSLVDAHHDHEEEEGDPVDDAVGADSEVASIFAELLVDEHRNQTCRGIHEEGPQPYSERSTGNLGTEPEDALAEVDDILAGREVYQAVDRALDIVEAKVAELCQEKASDFIILTNIICDNILKGYGGKHAD